jgi:2,3-bisphosphoglycerate-independent phosphoglycerate mutase
MSTPGIAEEVLKKIKHRNYDFIVVNLAAPDMVGHSGNIPATIQAVQAADKMMGEVVNLVLAQYGAVVITADHGNAEAKIATDGGVQTSHTSNPVPLIVISRELMTSSQKKLPSGILADVAPTVLSLLGLNIPSTMTGHNLLGELI